VQWLCVCFSPFSLFFRSRFVLCLHHLTFPHFFHHLTSVILSFLFYTGTIFSFDLSASSTPPSVFRETTVAGFNAADFEAKQVGSLSLVCVSLFIVLIFLTRSHFFCLRQQQVFYASKDGTKIPMYVVAAKGVSLDGSNPTYLYGYGGFNISLQPSFSVSQVNMRLFCFVRCLIVFYLTHTCASMNRSSAVESRFTSSFTVSDCVDEACEGSGGRGQSARRRRIRREVAQGGQFGFETERFRRLSCRC